MSYDKELQFAVNLAKEAGEVMKRYFTADDIGTITKEDDTPLTVADTSINQLVIERVKSEYPGCGVIGEEDSYGIDKDEVWVVDPIDGTLAYSSGIAVATFCLAYVVKGEVKVSVVYEPLGASRMYTAVLGNGAFMNDNKIEVLRTDSFDKTLTVFGADKLNVIKTELNKKGSKNLWFHSFAFGAVKVADGTFVAGGMRYGSPWDAAAASLIVQEAGGKVTDIHGNPRKYKEWGDGVVVSNGALHEEIIKLINDEDSRD